MTAKPTRTAIGFRVKSGWACAVLLAGPLESPRLLDCRPIDLSDPQAPESRQPYHARMGKLEEDASIVEQRTQIVHQVTKESVADLLASYREAASAPEGAGLVVGSTADPSSISNPHIRAHALEGRLFRTVLEDALRSHGLSCLVIVERNAYARGKEILGRSEEELKRAVAALGRSRSGRWRAEEKLAALSAWMALV